MLLHSKSILQTFCSTLQRFAWILSTRSVLDRKICSFACCDVCEARGARMVKLPRDLQLIFKMTWILGSTMKDMLKEYVQAWKRHVLELVERNRLQGPQQPCPPATLTALIFADAQPTRCHQ